MRAFAIALVLAAHSLRLTDERLNAAREALGEIGVSVFFVISGYLITTLLVREYGRSGSIDLRAFFIRRARRLFPAYYAFLALVAVLDAAGVARIDPREFVIDGMYLRDYYVDSSTWLQHTWSLAVEMQFYVLWPALLLVLRRRGALFFSIAVIAVEPLVRVATYYRFPEQRTLMTIALHTRVDMLMFGCALALVLDRLPGWLRRACAIVSPPVSLAVLALCIAGSARYRGAFVFTIGMTVEGIVTALLLANILLEPQSPFARLLRTAPATWTGRISYSLYLWQQPLLYPVGASIFNVFPVGLAAAFAAAWASHRFIERRFFESKPVRLNVGEK